MKALLITMERHYQPVHAKSDVQCLKMQREEKKRKKDIKFQLAKDRATRNHIESMLLYETFR